jgi:hypothetical protein
MKCKHETPDGICIIHSGKQHQNGYAVEPCVEGPCPHYEEITIARDALQRWISAVNIVLAYDGPDETDEDDANWFYVDEALNILKGMRDEYGIGAGMTLPEIKEMLIELKERWL